MTRTTDLPQDFFRTFPATRYQGSKRKILHEIYLVAKDIPCQSALDLFSGSGVVSLLLRAMGKKVHANDYLLSSRETARLFLTYQGKIESEEDTRANLVYLLGEAPLKSKPVISEQYAGVYFTGSENTQLDRFCQNIEDFSQDQQILYRYAVAQACLKKRPYNLFHRANLGMRTKDVKRSFGNKKTWETPFHEHAYKCIVELDKFDFTYNGIGHTTSQKPSEEVKGSDCHSDLLYLDPPYLNGLGKSIDYADFYHFLEAIFDYSYVGTPVNDKPHKPLIAKPSEWHSKDGAVTALSRLAEEFQNSTILMNYRNDSALTPELVRDALGGGGRRASIITACDYKYALSKKGETQELFIKSTPAFLG